jgi:predicted ATPase
MQNVVPELDDIVVQDSATGNLGIYFKERGYSRFWNASEVSDGTMRTLALAAAIFDPRISLLILEEPENSVHPWIARAIADACSDAAQQKQLIVTTHSGIVMNAFPPESIVLVWRDKKGSHTRPLREMNTAVRKVLDSGQMDVFDLLTGGAIVQAVPHPPLSAVGNSVE